MGCAHSRFTVLFEGPFWIGLYEREENGLYAACKVTFGAEPSDAEVYAFLNRHWGSLRARFCRPNSKPGPMPPQALQRSTSVQSGRRCPPSRTGEKFHVCQRPYGAH